jgi:hypothetical protein
VETLDVCLVLFEVNYSYLCIKGIIRRLWHEGIFKARGTRAFKFPRAIIDNYARGTYNVLFYCIISKRFKQIFSKLKVICVDANFSVV